MAITVSCDSGGRPIHRFVAVRLHAASTLHAPVLLGDVAGGHVEAARLAFGGGVAIVATDDDAVERLRVEMAAAAASAAHRRRRPVPSQLQITRDAASRQLQADKEKY